MNSSDQRVEKLTQEVTELRKLVDFLMQQQQGNTITQLTTNHASATAGGTSSISPLPILPPNLSNNLPNARVTSSSTGTGREIARGSISHQLLQASLDEMDKEYKYWEERAKAAETEVEELQDQVAAALLKQRRSGGMHVARPVTPPLPSKQNGSS